MPRSKNPKKYWYAQKLLMQGKTIQKTRDELKNIFGSAISPNTLIEIKDTIEKSKLKKERGFPHTIGSIFTGKSFSNEE